MNIQDVFKIQALSNMAKPTNGLYDMVLQVFLMVIIGIIDDLCKMIPAFIKNMQERASLKMRNAITNAVATNNDEGISATAILLDKRHTVNTVTMMRMYPDDKNGSGSDTSKHSTSALDPSEMNLMVDAILAYVSRLDNIPTFCLIPNGNFMVSYKDKPIQITKDIYMKIDEIATDTKSGNVTMIRITLASNTLSASDISNFVQTVYNAHQEEMKNSLGKNIYFFDQKIKDPPPPPFVADAANKLNHKRMIIQTSPKQLAFTMTPFYSNKRFGNIFGTDVRKVQNRVEFFTNNREWYDAKGIPYQLGIMLSGLPGTGKTSLIRAIANMTKRHIVNVNFSSITTASQLKNLFYNDKIVVYTDTLLSDTKTYYIPIEQRLYVFEEIDAVGDILKQRRANNDEVCESIPDELTLGEILTVLDGTMEVPGRMFIMTSNHPEVLDRALLRPGRIDLNVRFENATRQLIAEMYEAYLETPFPVHRLSELPDSVLTPAEVSEVIMKYCKTDFDSDQVINDIINSHPYKISIPESSHTIGSQNEKESSPHVDVNGTIQSKDVDEESKEVADASTTDMDVDEESNGECDVTTAKCADVLRKYAKLLSISSNRIEKEKIRNKVHDFAKENKPDVVDKFLTHFAAATNSMESIAPMFPMTLCEILKVLNKNILDDRVWYLQRDFDCIQSCVDGLLYLDEHKKGEVTDLTLSRQFNSNCIASIRDILVVIDKHKGYSTNDEFFKDGGLAPFCNDSLSFSKW
jgi:hypothetical protein